MTEYNTDSSLWFITTFYGVLLFIVVLVMMQIKYIDYNDNFRKNNKVPIDNITNYYLDIGLNKDEALVMTKIFKQLKLECANLSNDDKINNYLDNTLNYKQNFYNKKLYKNIIKNTLKSKI